MVGAPLATSTPFVDGLFVQVAGRDAPVGVAFRVAVRLSPTDLVVPAGGRLELVIADTRSCHPGIPLFEQPTEQSGAATTVTVHHDPEHPSALRFLEGNPLGGFRIPHSGDPG